MYLPGGLILLKTDDLVAVEGASGGHVVDFLADAGEDGLIFGLALLRDPIDHIRVLRHSVKHSVDQLDDIHHILLHEAAGSDRRSADPA